MLTREERKSLCIGDKIRKIGYKYGYVDGEIVEITNINNSTYSIKPCAPMLSNNWYLDSEDWELVKKQKTIKEYNKQFQKPDFNGF